MGYARTSGSKGRMQQGHVEDTDGLRGRAGYPEVSMFTLLEGRGMYCFTLPKQIHRLMLDVVIYRAIES